MSIARVGSSSHAVAPSDPTLGEDFPIICESCLGPNPYVRMIKSDMAKECRISGSPFTSFRWQGALRRWKETIVCAAVAREKNLCQACLNDLEYAVPFHVRDEVMAALNAEDDKKSDVNREYHWANKKQKLEEDGLTGGDTYEKLQDNVDKLREFANLNPGPVVWQAYRSAPLTAEEQERLRQRRAMERTPPADKSITSLYVAGVPPSVSRDQLLPYFLAYGEVATLTVDGERLSAIVTYRERAAAEMACKGMHNNFEIKRTKLRVSWAKRKGSKAPDTGQRVADQGHDYYGPNAVSSSVVLPPTGGACAGKAPASSATGKARPPPGVRPPPGIKRAAPYPSQNPDAQGARPEREA